MTDIELADRDRADLEDRNEAAQLASVDRHMEGDCSGVVRPWAANHEAFARLMFVASLGMDGMEW